MSYGRGIKSQLSALEGYHWQPSGLSRAGNPPCTSGCILLLAMAQPHCLFGAFSSTKPSAQSRRCVTKVRVCGALPKCPRHMAAGLISATPWLNKASTLYTKNPRPQRQAPLWGTSTSPRCRGGMCGLAAGTALCPQHSWEVSVPLLPHSSRDTGPGGHGALPQGREAGPL